MTIIAVLLIVLFNLLISFGLAAIMYYLAILPIHKELAWYKSQLSNIKRQPAVNMRISGEPSGLPSMDDIPDEAFYGDSPEDYRTTPEQVEDELTARTYNTYNAPRISSFEQLKSLKT